MNDATEGASSNKNPWKQNSQVEELQLDVTWRVCKPLRHQGGNVLFINRAKLSGERTEKGKGKNDAGPFLSLFLKHVIANILKQVPPNHNQTFIKYPIFPH